MDAPQCPVKEKPEIVVPTRAHETSPTVSSPSAVTRNIVTVPVPIVNQEDIYAYVGVKGSLHDRSSTLFGASESEALAISKHFGCRVDPVINGFCLHIPPLTLVNALSKLGYKVVCSTGEAETVWTMQRIT